MRPLTPAQQRYREYLQSPHWQVLRLRILARARDHCEECGYFCGQVEAVLDSVEIDERTAELREVGEEPCEVCGRWCRFRNVEDNSGRVWLEVHHLTYLRVGREKDDDLAALCVYCHDEATERQQLRKQARELMPDLPSDATHSDVIAAMVGYLLAQQEGERQ